MTSRTTQMDANRIIAVMDRRIGRKTRSMAMVETTWGTVNTVGAGEASVFIYGSATASDGFRIIGGGYPDVGDTVKVAIDRATGDRWVMEPINAAATDSVITAHGSLSGLAADDHPQYTTAAEVDAAIAAGAVTDHDALTGVSANDHHNQAHAIDGADHTTAETNTALVLAPDGVGGVEFVAAPDGSDGMVPYYVASGDTFTVPLYKQGLFSDTIDVDGTLEIDGELIEVDPLTVSTAGGLYQPLDSDLTAIAALSTTSYGRSLLAAADAAAGRTALGLGTAATQASTAFDAAGLATAAQAASQPLDSDLTAIAALTTTSFGRALLTLASGAITSSTLTQVTAKILGRTTAGTGAIEEIAIGAGLTLAAGTLSGATALTVEEVDGTPTNAAITKIVFPNDSISIGGSVATVRQVPYGFIGAKSYNVGAQSIPNSTDTAVTFASEEFDTDGFHSTSANTSRMTIPAGMAGKYLIAATGLWAPNSTGRRFSYIKINGTTAVVGSQTEVVPSAGGYPSVPSAGVASLVAGDYVELWVNQTSGGALNFGYDSSAPSAQATLAITKLDAGRVGSGIGASVSGTSTALTSGAYTSLAFGAADTFDTDGFHDPSTNNTRLTIPAGMSGKYLFSGYASWTSAAQNDRRLAYRKNGGADVILKRSYYGNPGAAMWDDFLIVLDLVAGDYVEVRMYTDATETVTVYAASIMRLDTVGPAPTGSLVLLQTLTASASATLDFASWYSTLYDEYQIEFLNLVPATNNVFAYLRCSTDGGSSYDAGANYDVGSGYYYDGGVGIAASSGAGVTALRLLDAIGNGGSYAFSGSMKLLLPGSTSVWKTCFGQFHWFHATLSKIVGVNYSGVYKSTTAVNALRFLFSSGNITSGTIRIYGIAK